MTDTETRVLRVIRELLGSAAADRENPLDARLIEDLRADSLDLVDLTMLTEDEFGVEITDDEAEPFVGDTGTAAKTVREWCELVDTKLAAQAEKA